MNELNIFCSDSLGRIDQCNTEYYLASDVDEKVAKLSTQIEALLSFVKDVATNYDCDEDVHKYNTTCHVCEAEKLLKKIQKDIDI